MLREAYRWSSFLSFGSGKDLWQASIYLTVVEVISMFSVFLFTFIDKGLAQSITDRWVLLTAAVMLSLFNYSFANKNIEQIAAERNVASSVVGYCCIVGLIFCGIRGMMYS